MERILVVDDEPDIQRVVRAYLEREGYSVDTVGDGLAAVDRLEAEEYDLMVLDLMLPSRPGEEICQAVRRKSDIPIIMLTAKGSEEERVDGLNLGADDYLVKPFSPRELVARVKALLRRCRVSSNRQLVNRMPVDRLEVDKGKLVIDLSARKVYVRGEEVRLTPTEFKLLVTLAESPGRVFERSHLVDIVLGYDFDGYDDTIYAHIKNLRKKLEDDPASPRYIQTVYGMGYRFLDEK